jgi:phenylacetate-CoA ligase
MVSGNPTAAGRALIQSSQLQSLNSLLGKILPANAFYRRKTGWESKSFNTLAEYSESFPFTQKSELVQDQLEHPLYGTDLTYPTQRYTRLHATSGTTGRPLRWLDTPESWHVLVNCWLEVYRAAGITEDDIAFFAFSFGPFLGFWTAFEAANRAGVLSIPGGGLSTLLRLNLLIENKVTLLCCTPTYAIHLGEVAVREKIDLSKSVVRKIIVAGEPGGSIAATRARIEGLWNGAQVFDHHGMTETGPISYECPAHPCRLHIIDEHYFAEVVDPQTGRAVETGKAGELIITTLHRDGSPLLRYRTGDLVQLSRHHALDRPCECGRYETALEGGIIGRVDDMVVIRGVNIYPAAIEEIVRKYAEVAEYQVRVTARGSMRELALVIEPVPYCVDVTGLTERIEKALQTAFTLRIPTSLAAVNSLPRAEMKARRWIMEPSA